MLNIKILCSSFAASLRIISDFSQKMNVTGSHVVKSNGFLFVISYGSIITSVSVSPSFS